WKAGCGESRTSGLEWGKDREVLPITTPTGSRRAHFSLCSEGSAMDRDREGGELASAHESRCCVVGAGPAGAVLGLLLARGGVPVTLLESHPDFDRDFRGDTVHPPTLELLAQLGL